MKNKNRKQPNVLHLARWYPNRYDPMFGLFVRRHIEAVSQFTDVSVVYVHPVEKGLLKTKYEVTLSVNPFPEVIVYYVSDKNTPVPLKLFRFLKAVWLGIKKAKETGGRFQRVHVHILTRLGVVALLLKYMWGTPYVITEHWSRYQPVTGNYKGFLRKLTTKTVAKKAAIITTPTQNLAQAMQKQGLRNRYEILPNVINPVFFEEYPVLKNDKYRFVHVSCFEDRSKNVSGIIRVVKELSKKRHDFVMTLIGEGMDLERMKYLAKSLEIPRETLVFTGLLEGESLASEMAKGDALIVFSNYENMPVVINESFALGIPVVATSVGGIPEVLDREKGILIPPGDENALLHIMEELIEGKHSFDREKLKTYAYKHFSYDAVGRQIAALYY